MAVEARKIDGRWWKWWPGVECRIAIPKTTVRPFCV